MVSEALAQVDSKEESKDYLQNSKEDDKQRQNGLSNNNNNNNTLTESWSNTDRNDLEDEEEGSPEHSPNLKTPLDKNWHHSTPSNESADSKKEQISGGEEEERNENRDDQEIHNPIRRQSTINEMTNKVRKSIPGFLKPHDGIRSWSNMIYEFCIQNLNFYRIHLLVFTFTPLIFAAIFYASNTNPISFIDCLFVCVSAMTVTGLATINVSSSTAWQQAILFFLMAIGNITAVSVTMIWIRRHFFRVKFDSIIRRSAKARKRMNDVEFAHRKQKRKDLIRLQKLVGLKRSQKYDHKNVENGDAIEFTPRSSASIDEIVEAEMRAEMATKKKERQKKKHQGPLRVDMIRRMDNPAVLINPMGAISHTIGERTMDSSGGGGSGGVGSGGGGGILNSYTGTVDNRQQSNNSSNGEEEQNGIMLPNIRIAEPNVPPSQIRSLSKPESPKSPKFGRESPEKMSEKEEEKLQDFISSSEKKDIQIPPYLTDPNSNHMRARFVDENQTKITRLRRESDPPIPLRYKHSRQGSDDFSPSKPIQARLDMFPRAQTIEFAEPPSQAHTMFTSSSNARASGINEHSHGNTFEQSLRYRNPLSRNEFERTPTMVTQRSGLTGNGGIRRIGTNGIPITRTQTTSKERGFGGFPTPFELAGSAIKRALPQVQERFKRTTTVPRTSTFVSTHSIGDSGSISGGGVGGINTKSAPYLSFDATVSRNSRFHQLTEAQRDELGGVEYRAIDLLAKLIPIYWLGVNFFFIILVAPWLASKSAVKVHQVIGSQGVNAPNTTWFWFFQVISAYSNTGLSLIDTSMIELNDQYLMLIPIGLLILAGNTAFPILLRFFIWILTCFVPKQSRTYETLRFLLDHPRRCFIYLFPSAQTWFLFGLLLLLNCFDWIMFQILDLGNRTIEQWSVGLRIFDGLFQSIAVRAAGFQIISLLELAPAVQFLYIIMMYISAYPVAMSVRNTNVYEERSLGIFNDSKPGEEDEPEKGGARVWGTYLAAHARRQLAFDMWWLGFALWLVCIIERNNIQDPTSNGYFTVFSCLFELTSAYGTVGLSLGTPNTDYSLSGNFHTLSKLVVIAVMLRGRHRGLPVAIDRAVLLPDELEIEDDAFDRAYTIDEDGFFQSRSSYYLDDDDDDEDDQQREEDDKSNSQENNTIRDLKSMNTATSSTQFFPRSTTGSSIRHQKTPQTNSGTPRMKTTFSPGINATGYEGKVPIMDLDSSNSVENKTFVDENHLLSPKDAINRTNQKDNLTIGFLSSSHHPLSSIREAVNSPFHTPSEDESKKIEGLQQIDKTRSIIDGNGEEASSHHSNFSNSSSSEKGKQKAKDQSSTSFDLKRESELALKYGSCTEEEAEAVRSTKK